MTAAAAAGATAAGADALGRALALSSWSTAASKPTGVVHAVGGGGTAVPASASANGRYLLDQNGSPFLLLGCQLLPGLANGSLANIEQIIDTCNTFGFNAIWMTLMPDAGVGAQDSITDYNGNTPFTSLTTAPAANGSNAVTAFWTNVDSVVSYAASKGVTMLLCPVETSGQAMVYARGWGNAGCNAYGQFLGNRYKNSPNVCWWNGNDFGAGNSWTGGPPSQSDDTLMENVYAGIKAAGDTHLQSIELNYNLSLSTDDGSSGGWRSLVNADLAYTYFQTYDPMLHGWLGINSDDPFGTAQRYAPKPIFLGEENYEGANDAGGNPASAYTLRCQDYWTVLAGGLAGQVWGNKIVHHFLSGWQTNLNTPGWQQAGIWAAFFRSIAWYNLVPDGMPDPTVAANHTFVTAGFGTYVGGQSSVLTATNNTNGSLYQGTYVTAALTADGSLGVVYTPVNQALTVNMAKMRGSVTARWFDPTTGIYTAIGAFPNTGSLTFPPPGAHSDGASDWVLVLTA